MSGPLTGIRVLDVTHYAVGPWACALLGEMGAEVIKIEPPDGDYLSRQPPPWKNGITAVYIAMNVNKRIAQWDLRDELVREAMHQLVLKSDVIIENHRPGFMERRGLAYEQVAEINPGIVYCASSGYGSRGPYKQMGSTDPYGQAISGFASVSGPVGGPGEGLKQGGHIDLSTSQYIVAGVLAALYRRKFTGRGQFIDMSQMQAAVAYSGTRAQEYFATAEDPVPMGSGVSTVVPSRSYRAADGKYLNITANTEAEWQGVCATLGLAAEAADARMQSNASRIAHRDAVDAAIEAVVATRNASEWLPMLQAHRVPSSLYLTYNNIRIDPQVREQGMLDQFDGPWGRVTLGGVPWRFSRTPGAITPTHVPGEDSEALLQEYLPERTS
ncbi:MAG: CoA transferase [Chloroflexi bacterium]|nr:CoA transferase [Chloroflexota bacterium]